MNLGFELERLMEIVGKDKMVEICKEFRGTSVYFPARIENEIIQEQIRIDYHDKNLTYPEIARKYRRTMDNVRKICKEPPKYLYKIEENNNAEGLYET
jgi:Mor family transcriptional regulator